MALKNFILGIGIVILTIFVTLYGLNVFYPSVQYSDYCGEHPRQVLDSESLCVDNGGRWNNYSQVAPQKIDSTTPEVVGYCEYDYYCRQEYDTALRLRSRNVFFIGVSLGILIIVLGAYLFSLEAVGSGLMGGGVGTMIFSIGGYWSYSDDWMKFLISLTGLVVLIWFTHWFNSHEQSKKGLIFSIRKRIGI